MLARGFASNSNSFRSSCQAQIDLFICGFVCKLFSQESNVRYTHRSVSAMFLDPSDPSKLVTRLHFKIHGSCDGIGWLLVTSQEQQQKGGGQFYSAATKARNAIPFVEAVRFIKQFRPKSLGLTIMKHL